MQSFGDKTLTSANSTVLWRAKGYNDQFARLEGYQADNAFTFGEGAIGETVMGVDGFQSGAYTPHEVDFNVHLQANSPSRFHLDQVFNKIIQQQETMLFEFQIDIPSIKMRFICKGFPVNVARGATAKKTLDGANFSWKLGEITPETMA
ncbi:hypothetical protein [Wielerella bovis]|uniref:hypothetical protein n=1 Tax=Wielerella bovis TaxID=2917790 RepID=UPI002018C696|nr:hypothetical protein [Wielerella bovis]ULJ66171.1 hypothetical protein MIS31_07795 [Wielerella bovis]